jgi:tRNA1Val (adenine37-N6)-methyltransferase
MTPSDEPIGSLLLTQDQALRGRLRLWQPAQGYRFAIDAFLVADFAAGALLGRRVVDLGAGCGVVGITLAERFPDLSVTLVELQSRLAALAERNAHENGMAHRVTVICGDLRRLQGRLAGETADTVVSNPPFLPIAAGQPSRDPERRVALSEVEVSLAEVIQAAKRLLVPGGSLYLIYPAERVGAVLTALGEARLSPTHLRPVYPHTGQPAHRVLISARKTRRSRLVLDPPLIIHEAPGRYSDEVARILGDTPGTPGGPPS